MSFLVFDIGGTSVKYGLFNEQAQLIEKKSFQRQPTLEHLVAKMLEQYKKYEPIGISLAVPGAPNEKEGVIYGASALDYLHGPNIKEIFKEHTHLEIRMENDANCAALGEVYFGNAQEYDDIAYVVLGSGVGGAIVKNRQIHRGVNLHGGEFGYWIVNEKLQNWSELGSTLNLVKRVQKLLNDKTIDGAEVFELAKKNKVVANVVNEFYELNARCLFNVQYCFDPSIILLGGAISENEEVIAQLKIKIEDVYRRCIGTIKPQLECGSFQADANLYGALANLLFIES